MTGQKESQEEKRQETAELLDRLLGPEFVSRRSGPGGSAVTYLEGQRVIWLANRVLGFDGWSSSVTDITVDFVHYPL